MNAMYSSCSVICIKSCSLTVVLACIAALVLSVLGTGLAVSSFGLLFDNVNSIFAWALGKIDFIQAEMTVSDINGNPTLVPPLTNATFQSVKRLLDSPPIRDGVLGLQPKYQKYVEDANLGLTLLSTVPIASSAPFSTFDIEAERQKFFRQEPGLFLWFVVPAFESLAPFKNVSAQVQDAELSTSRAACNAMVSICTDSPSPVWSVAAPGKVYKCAVNATTYNATCATFQRVSELVGNMTVLNGSPVGCANVSAIEQSTKCTMGGGCATECTSTTCDKKIATDIILNLRYATAAIRAFNVAVLPLAVTYSIIFELLIRLTVLADDFTFVGVGLCLFTIFFFVDLFVVFRGQKRFFSLVGVVVAAPVDADATEPAAAAPVAVHASDAPPKEESSQAFPPTAADAQQQQQQPGEGPTSPQKEQPAPLPEPVKV